MEMNLGVLLDPFFSLFHEVAAEVVEHNMELFAGMERHELIHEIKEFDAAFALSGLSGRAGCRKRAGQSRPR
jgi:hypothetical protein